MSSAGERSSEKRTKECLFPAFAQKEVPDEHHTSWKERVEGAQDIYPLGISQRECFRLGFIPSLTFTVPFKTAPSTFSPSVFQ